MWSMPPSFGASTAGADAAANRSRVTFPATPRTPGLMPRSSCARRPGGRPPARPHGVEAEADRGSEAEQPFEVGGGEAEPATVDRALGADEVGVDPVGGGRARPGGPEDDPQLVHEDLLAGPIGVEVGGVEDLA